ncbi:MAG: ABC transporter ATP-binding protein, partial [Pseudomonadota bacterium]|nr:ABC transporter ATP-binding protein [Pseudomonadota bacterium]
QVSKAFRAIRIATELDLVVAPNEAVGVLGPNGAGKTTLLGLITGALALDAGAVAFFGRDVSRLPTEERCRIGIARAYQVPQPFGDMTVFENLMVGAAFGGRATLARAREKSLQLLEECGLGNHANTPAGRLTLLNRKRLELARALATDPKLLLLDEIAGGLSQPECEDLVGLVKRVHASGVTIVWIEHVLHALMSVVSRALVLYQGKFIADGPPQEVIRDPKVAEIYMGIEADA